MHTTAISSSITETRQDIEGSHLKATHARLWPAALAMLPILVVCLFAVAVVHPQRAYAEDSLVLERGDKLTQNKHINLYYMRDQKTKRVLYCISPNFAQPEPGHTLMYNGRVMDWTSGETPPGAGFKDNETVSNRRLAARLDYLAYHGYFGDTTMKIGNVTGDANQLYLTTQLAINRALLNGRKPTRLFNDPAVTEDIDQASELLCNQANAYAEDVIEHGGHHVEDHTALWFKNSEEGTWQNILTREPRGRLRIQKASAEETITRDNPDYSLEGARFGVYADDTCTPGKELEVVTTDEDGSATTASELACGDYWVKELTSSHGYAVSCDKVTVHIAGGPQTAVVREPIDVLPIGTLIAKVDAETGTGSNPAGRSLEGARFNVSYYAGTNTSASPTRSWTLRSDANGKVALDPEHVADTDSQPFYRGTDGSAGMPCGTVVVTETAAPEGYIIPQDQTWTLRIAPGANGKPILVNPEDGTTSSPVWNTITVQEPPIRGDIAFDKVEEDTQERMANVVFRVTSKASGEWHLVKTDGQGHFSSQDHTHSHATNELDAALLQDGTINEDQLSGDTGLWFFGSQQQSGLESATVDDARGAFPYGSYHFDEIGTSATVGHSLISFDVDVRENGSVASPGTISDPVVTLKTSARDASDQDKYLSDTGERAIEDTVEYTGLIPGSEYTLTCTLHNAATGAELTDDSGRIFSGEVVFTPTQPTGSQTIRVIADNLPADVSYVVAYERLTQNAQLIASHEDPQDREQTVYVPSLKTTLTDAHDADHSIPSDTRSTLTDAVSYRGLIPGRSYRIEGKLVDKGSGDTLQSSDGSQVTSSVEFVPSSSEGIVNVSFSIDASGLADHQIVAVETLLQESAVICSHESLEDADQTVSVVRQLVSLPNTGSLSLVGTIATGLSLLALAMGDLLRRHRR